MNAIVPFSFDSHQVRIVTDDHGEPMFVAKDLVEAVDAVWKGDQGSLPHVPEEYKGVCSVQTPGGIQQLVCLTEQGMYFYLIRSDKPKALPLQKMVSGEILPSIRKTGSYTAPKAIPADRPTKVFPEYFRIAKLIGLDKNAAALSANQATYKKTGENVLALMGVTHLETEQPWFTPTDLGKRIDVSGRQFNLLLLESGLQTKEGDHWLPTDAAKGLFRFFDTNKRHMDGSIVLQLKWSGDVLNLINREAA